MKQTSNNLFSLHEYLQFTGSVFKRGVIKIGGVFKINSKRFSHITRRACFIRIRTRMCYSERELLFDIYRICTSRVDGWRRLERDSYRVTERVCDVYSRAARRHRGSVFAKAGAHASVWRHARRVRCAVGRRPVAGEARCRYWPTRFSDL